jgi:predicted CxxxxCH...CXXCH cytochrome family protein
LKLWVAGPLLLLTSAPVLSAESREPERPSPKLEARSDTYLRRFRAPARRAALQIAGRAFAAEPRYEGGSCVNSYCHGDSFIGGRPSGGSLVQPLWTVVDGSQVSCGTCHGLPPPLPHPEDADICSDCHHNIDSDRNFALPLLHVDGIVTFFVP